MTAINLTTAAGIAGRIAGTAARGLIWVHNTIDWAEVGAIVLEGLQVLIVLTLLAGRATRRAWDALPGISEQLGRWYSRLLVGAIETVQTARHTMIHPLAELATELEQLSLRELQILAGSRQKIAKRRLVARLVAMI